MFCVSLLLVLCDYCLIPYCIQDFPCQSKSNYANSVYFFDHLSQVRWKVHFTIRVNIKIQTHIVHGDRVEAGKTLAELFFFDWQQKVLLRHAMPCYTLLRHAMPCYAMLCPATPCYALLHPATSCYALLRHAMPCYALLCPATPCYVMLCPATSCYALPHPAVPCYAMNYYNNYYF